jgi:toxin HigB-1
LPYYTPISPLFPLTCILKFPFFTINIKIIVLSIFDKTGIDIINSLEYIENMRVIFANEDLDRLEIDWFFSAGLSQILVKAYRNKLNIIRQATDERDFYALKSLHFEKLEGKRKHQHSMRLNDQYRLIVELIESSPTGKTVKIVEIVDYH